MKKLILILFFLLPSTFYGLDIPPLGGHVNDRAGLLSPHTQQDLEFKLTEFERQTSTQIAILIVPSLEGESLEDYTIRVVQTWKLGQKNKDNGALLFIAAQDKALRIEVGYGLEAILTDALSNQIIRKEIVPQFKNGNFDVGITAGVQAIMLATQGTYKANQQTDDSSSNFITLLFIFFILFIIFSSLPGRRSRYIGGFGGFGGGWRGGGFGSGGGFSGGGGSFGGGGSSGSW
jgi:uncharacterized protein